MISVPNDNIPSNALWPPRSCAMNALSINLLRMPITAKPIHSTGMSSTFIKMRVRLFTELNIASLSELYKV